MLFRYAIGWGIGVCYAHMREEKLRQYDVECSILSIFSHNPSLAVFTEMIQYLKREGFCFLSTDDLLDRKLPAGRKAWLTFDDGWLACKDVVLPLAEKEGVPFTIFISPKETMRGEMWTAHVPPERKQELYTLPDEERYSIVDKIISETGRKAGKRSLLSAEDVQKLSRHPLVTIENHTWSHLSCAHRPTVAVMDSVERATAEIESWTGRRPRMVCYPFGHWTDETDCAIRKAGYVPVTIRPGVMTSDTPGKYRNLFYDNMSFLENSCRIVGAWRKIKDQKSGQF